MLTSIERESTQMKTVINSEAEAKKKNKYKWKKITYL